MSKIAVVTGASKGLGEAITRRLAKEKVKVVACARSADLLEKIANENPNVFPYPCDITQNAEVKQLISFAIRRFGKLDYLINNAGVGYFAPLDELTEDAWDEMMNVNVKGVFLTCKYAIPYLKKSEGHIINISSVAGIEAFPNGGGYCASKFALMGLSEALIKELKPYHVKVTTICPGSIKTNFGTMKDYALEPEDLAETVWTCLSAPKGMIYNQLVIRPLVPQSNPQS